MKKFVLLLLFAAYAFSASTFYVNMHETTGRAIPGEARVLEGYVHNSGSSDIFMQASRITNDLPSDWTTTLCFGDNCYPPFVDVVPLDNNGNPAYEMIAVGDSSFFDITFNTAQSTRSEQGEAVIVFLEAISGEQDTVRLSVSNETITTSYADTLQTAVSGDPVQMSGYVHNVSQDTIDIKMERVSNDIPASWSTTLQFGSNSYPAATNEATETCLPGDSLFYAISFNTDNTDNQGSARIRFTDLKNVQEISQTFTVVTETPVPAFSVSIPDTSAEIQAGQSHEFKGMVYNTSDKPLTFFLVRRQNDIPASWSTSLCFDACPQAEVDTVSSSIMNGDSLEYTITFNTGDQTAGNGSVLIAWYAESETDTVTQVFTVKTTITDIEDPEPAVITSFRILGNYPNPFNPGTTIRYQLPQLSRVAVTVYDVSGKAVFTQDLGRQHSGVHQFCFNAEGFSSGTYLYRIQANGKVQTGKMLLLK